MRFVVDCNAYVVLVQSNDAKIAAIRRAEAGGIEFLMTHLQWDEIACLDDRDIRMSICDIPRRNVPTHRVIRELSRAGGQGATETPTQLAGMNDRIWQSDFLISVTAQYDDAVLVTDDTEIARRARVDRVEVWPTSRLEAFLLRDGG